MIKIHPSDITNLWGSFQYKIGNITFVFTPQGEQWELVTVIEICHRKRYRTMMYLNDLTFNEVIKDIQELVNSKDWQRIISNRIRLEHPDFKLILK